MPRATAEHHPELSRDECPARASGAARCDPLPTCLNTWRNDTQSCRVPHDNRNPRSQPRENTHTPSDGPRRWHSRNPTTAAGKRIIVFRQNPKAVNVPGPPTSNAVRVDCLPHADKRPAPAREERRSIVMTAARSDHRHCCRERRPPDPDAMIGSHPSRERTTPPSSRRGTGAPASAPRPRDRP